MVTKVARIHQKTKRPLNCGLSKVKVHLMVRLRMNKLQQDSEEKFSGNIDDLI